MAKLIFKYSTMNSGKSMDLIRTVHNYIENDCKVLVMKPLVDTKGGNMIETRAGLTQKTDVLIPEGFSILKLLIGRLDDVACIFIDEAQFLSAKQINHLFVVAHVIDIPVKQGMLTEILDICAPEIPERCKHHGKDHEIKEAVGPAMEHFLQYAGTHDQQQDYESTHIIVKNHLPESFLELCSFTNARK